MYNIFIHKIKVCWPAQFLYTKFLAIPDNNINIFPGVSSDELYSANYQLITQLNNANLLFTLNYTYMSTYALSNIHIQRNEASKTIFCADGVYPVHGYIIIHDHRHSFRFHQRHFHFLFSASFVYLRRAFNIQQAKTIICNSLQDAHSISVTFTHNKPNWNL